MSSNFTFAGQYGPTDAITTKGLPLPGTAFTVYLHGTQTLATLYTDRTKGTTTANPFLADTKGNISFFADPATYDLAGIGSTLVVNVQPDPAEVTLVGASNVESLMRTQSPDVLTPAPASLNLNSQKIINLAPGVNARDAAQLFQANAWCNDPSGWGRVSNTSFTEAAVGGNFIYFPGTKLTWAESGVVKYGVVATANWASNVTTITMVPTTDYVMAANPDALTNQFTYGSPPVFPNRFAWAPTGLTGFSVNPTSPLSWWSVQGGMCTINAYFFVAGTSNDVVFTFAAPIAASATTVGFGNGVDNGVAAPMYITLGSSTISLFKSASTTTWVNSGSKNCAFQMSYPI